MNFVVDLIDLVVDLGVLSQSLQPLGVLVDQKGYCLGGLVVLVDRKGYHLVVEYPQSQRGWVLVDRKDYHPVRLAARVELVDHRPWILGFGCSYFPCYLGLVDLGYQKGLVYLD